jgi:hypothetical protein
MRPRRGERGVMGHRLQVVPALILTQDGRQDESEQCDMLDEEGGLWV